MKQFITHSRDADQHIRAGEYVATADKVAADSRVRGDTSAASDARPQVTDSMEAIATRACVAMSAARGAGPGRDAVAGFGEDEAGPRSGVTRALMDVLCAAVQVESDPIEAGLWCARTSIAELGGITAVELVSLGRTDEVIGFLHAVRDGARDW